MKQAVFDRAASAVTQLLSASAVTQLLSASAAAVPHPQIVSVLTGQGFTKDAAKSAIGRCQARGWIEHDLTTGYVLAGLSADKPEGCY